LASTLPNRTTNTARFFVSEVDVRMTRHTGALEQFDQPVTAVVYTNDKANFAIWHN
jgi:hypothetical protein